MDPFPAKPGQFDGSSSSDHGGHRHSSPVAAASIASLVDSSRSNNRALLRWIGIAFVSVVGLGIGAFVGLIIGVLSGLIPFSC